VRNGRNRLPIGHDLWQLAAGWAFRHVPRWCFSAAALDELAEDRHETERQEDEQRLADLLARAQVPRHVAVSPVLARPKEIRAALTG
jgi:hypothetical protein